MTEITAANLPGKVVGPKVAYLTDEFTNRDIFGTARGRCKECDGCGEYLKATADYTVSASDTGVRRHPDNDISIINCSRCGCPPNAHEVLIAQQEQEAGKEAYAAGAFSKAVAHYSRALREQSQDAVLLSNRAACYLAMKWYPQAKLDAERAVSLRPDWAKANARLAAAYAGLRQLEKAIEIYTLCTKLAPGDKQYVSALNETRAEMQKAAADAEAVRENGQRAQAGARSGANAERSQRAPVHAPAVSGRPAMEAASGREKQVNGMPVPGKARQSAGVDEGAPQDSAAVLERKLWRPQSAPGTATNGSAHVTAEHIAAIRGSVQAKAPAEGKAAVWQRQTAADCAANGTAHDAPERKAAAASTALPSRKVPDDVTHTSASGSYGDALLDAMLSDPAGTPQQSPQRAPTLHKGTQAAGRPSRSRPGSPGQPTAAPGTPPATGVQHQYLEVLIRNMQRDHVEKVRALREQMASLEADVSKLRAELAHLVHSTEAAKGTSSSGPSKESSPQGEEASSTVASGAAAEQSAPVMTEQPQAQEEVEREHPDSSLPPEEQARRNRMRAAEQRRAEAEQTGELLQYTSCDSITQVQRKDCTACAGCSGFQLWFRPCDANDPQVMLHCSVCGCPAHLHTVDRAWQEEEDARKRREESDRRWRARTASSQGPVGRNALAAAARALNVDTDADERQIRKAWKRAALETHPDKTGESGPFIRVSQAYTLLMGAC